MISKHNEKQGINYKTTVQQTARLIKQSLNKSFIPCRVLIPIPESNVEV